MGNIGAGGILTNDAAHGARGGGTLHVDVVAAGDSGFMAGADKTKLNGIEALADVTDTANVQAALPVADTTVLVAGSADATKLIRIEADGLTTATTRVLTMPDADITPDDQSASRVPSGSAGGDLSGTYPNPAVNKIEGVDVSSTPPTTGQVLTATSGTAADWQTPAGVPDPFTPPDGTWNVIGGISVRASGGAAGSEQFGEGASASLANSTAVGLNSSAGSKSIALGQGASATVSEGVAVGASSLSSSSSGCAVGFASEATGSAVIAIGHGARGTIGNSVSVGKSADVRAADAVAVGKSATVINASSPGGIAIGRSSAVLATHINAVAIGLESQTTAAQRTTIGRVGGTAAQLQQLQVSAGFAAFGGAPPATQPSAITDVPTGGSATAAANATAINSMLAVLRGAGLIAP